MLKDVSHVRSKAAGRAGRNTSLYSLVALAGTFALSPLAIRFLSSRNLVDVPNRRSSHEGRVLRGLGVAPAIACGLVGLFAASSLPDLWFVIVPAALMAGLGLMDDVRGLPVGVRLPAQFAVGSLMATGLLWDEPFGFLFIAAGMAWFASYVNAYNFMDGINGISGFHAAGIGIAWSLGGLFFDGSLTLLIGLILTAGAIGYLPYNFPRARAFLGDVGSYFFGGWVAAGAVVVAIEVHVLLAFLPLSIYVADTAWTLALRVHCGEVWHEAHRDHVYQRLVRGGWSHTRTTVLVGVLTLVLGGCGVVGSLGGTWMVVGSVVVAGLLNALYLAGPRIAFDEVPGVGGMCP